MILNVVIYDTEEGTRFKVHKQDEVDVGCMRDVTDEYDVMATETGDGRSGIAVLVKVHEDQERHPTGAEL